jgi:hypothetical protein
MTAPVTYTCVACHGAKSPVVGGPTHSLRTAVFMAYRRTG